MRKITISQKDYEMIKRHRIILIIFSLLLLLPIIGLAENKITVIKGGEIHTISGGVIPNGMIIIENGKIQSVGKASNIPSSTKIIEANGLIVTPGIIDSRSRYGLTPRMRLTQLTTPEQKIIDFFKQRENPEWLKGGVTATYIAPPAQNLIGGFGAVVKLVGIKEEALINSYAGMSISFGESVLRTFKVPTTRQGMLGKMRLLLFSVQEKLKQPGRKEKTEISDFQTKAIEKVLRREVPIRAVANTPDDIMTALRLAKEFNLKMIIDSAAGAHRVAPHLAEARVPVVVGPSIIGLGSGGPFEMFAHTPENAAQLHKAGVKIALSTDSISGRSVLLEGIIAKSHGLPEDIALQAITLNAAEILGVADRLGSLEAGKDADIVLWKGHPLSTWGETRMVIVNGQVVFERGK